MEAADTTITQVNPPHPGRSQIYTPSPIASIPLYISLPQYRTTLLPCPADSRVGSIHATPGQLGYIRSLSTLDSQLQNSSDHVLLTSSRQTGEPPYPVFPNFVLIICHPKATQMYTISNPFPPGDPTQVLGACEFVPSASSVFDC